MIARPLNWKPTRDGLAMRALAGDSWYEIWGPRADGKCRTYLPSGEGDVHATLDEAKAACQAHADRAVLGQLHDHLLTALAETEWRKDVTIDELVHEEIMRRINEGKTDG